MSLVTTKPNLCLKHKSLKATITIQMVFSNNVSISINKDVSLEFNSFGKIMDNRWMSMSINKSQVSEIWCCRRLQDIF